jgi:hypothetical protein
MPRKGNIRKGRTHRIPVGFKGKKYYGPKGGIFYKKDGKKIYFSSK